MTRFINISSCSYVVSSFTTTIIVFVIILLPAICSVMSLFAMNIWILIHIIMISSSFFLFLIQLNSKASSNSKYMSNECCKEKRRHYLWNLYRNAAIGRWKHENMLWVKKQNYFSHKCLTKDVHERALVVCRLVIQWDYEFVLRNKGNYRTMKQINFFLENVLFTNNVELWRR